MHYLVTVVDTQHEAWAALVNHEGNLADVVRTLAQHDKAEVTEGDAVLLKSWLARLGAPNLLTFEKIDPPPPA